MHLLNGCGGAVARREVAWCWRNGAGVVVLKGLCWCSGAGGLVLAGWLLEVVLARW